MCYQRTNDEIALDFTAFGMEINKLGLNPIHIDHPMYDEQLILKTSII